MMKIAEWRVERIRKNREQRETEKEEAGCKTHGELMQRLSDGTVASEMDSEL